MATAFGIFTGILSTISFLQSNIPSNDGASSKVRVYVALDGTNGLTNAGGDAPDIRQFNNNPDFIGATYDPGYIGSGDFRDVKISQSARQQAVYSLLTANNDAICIAYLTTTWADGSQYAFAGNWGHTCGQAWYYSGVYQDNKELECLWIDGNNGDGDKPVTAFHVKWPEFDENGFSQTNDDNVQSRYCNNVGPLNFQTANDPGTIYTKRDTSYPKSNAYPPRLNKVRDARKLGTRALLPNTHLVMTSRPGKSARTLCESSTSVGPNFVNLAEGLYCDMGTKNLLSLCQGLKDISAKCFDVEQLAIKSKGVVLKFINFSKIIDWGNGTDLVDTAQHAIETVI